MQMPHPLDRKHQQETYNKIINSKAKFIIVQAPTGSGKSAWAAQAACDGYKTIALTHTKSLQAQYELSYSFTTLFGKANYECLDFDREEEQAAFGFVSANYIQPTCDLCVVSEKNKRKCKDNCPYYLDRQDFIYSVGGSLNYHKFLLDRYVVEEFRPHYLFFDEAHLLSNLVVDFSGITLPWNSKKLMRYCQPVYIDKPQPLAVSEGKEWLQSLYWSLKDSEPLHPHDGGDVWQWKYWERKLEQVDITLASLDIAPEYWFVKSDSEKFICRPLTARFHFDRLFDKAPKIVMMSATIGQVQHFIRELGIADYEFINVPNIWPAPLRIVEDLKAPKIGYKAPKEDWLEHSRLIAERINKCPDNWTGIIHSPSKWLTWDLAERIGKLTGRPIHTPDENDGTEAVAEKWLQIQDDGTIGVFWQLWEGIDAGKDNFCCVAKVPFVDFSQSFDKERFMFDGKSGYQRISNKMVQGLGRIRRGKKEHYGNSKVVCLADGHWKRLRNYIGKDILDSIV
jgi:Rad3-related DNA helicase